MNNVEEIKSRLSIEDVVSQYVKLTPAGSNLKARCPFHNERTPSFMVSPSRQTYHCFGCDAGGDIFTFVESIEGLDFKGALKILADKAGVELIFDPRHKEESNERDILFEIMEEATTHHSNILKNIGMATDYLKERGLTEETIKSFRIGFAPDAWDTIFEHLKKKGFDEKLIEKAGLIKKGDRGYYDRLRSRLLFPITDSAGRVVAFTGRFLQLSGSTAKLEKEPAKYINSPETALYHKSKILYGYDRAKQPIRRTDFAILVEGQMDVIAAHQAGYTNTVALSGTALSHEQVVLLSRMSKNLVIALDADNAGVTSSKKSARAALREGFDVKIAVLPEGKDPADILKDSETSVWKKIVKDSKHVIDFLLDMYEKESKDSRTFKLKATKEVLPFLYDIQNAVDRAHFIARVANRLGVSENVILQELSRVTLPKVEDSALSHKGGRVDTQGTPQDQLVAIYAWQAKAKTPLVTVDDLDKKLREALGEKVFEKLLGKTLKRRAALFEMEALFDDSDTLKKAIKELFGRIKVSKIQEDLKETTQRLRKAEEKGDAAEIEEILKKCNELREKLATAE